MPKIAPIDSKIFEKFLLFIGCEFKRQKGSHRMFFRAGLIRPIVIVSGDEMAPAHVRQNLKALKISEENYLDILKQL